MIEVLLALSIIGNVVCFIYTISLIKKIQIVNKAESLDALLNYENGKINNDEEVIDF